MRAKNLFFAFSPENILFPAQRIPAELALRDFDRFIDLRHDDGKDRDDNRQYPKNRKCNPILGDHLIQPRT